MSKINRREFIGGLAALGAAGVGGCKLPGYCGLGESVYGGIPLGVITFSYWHMPVGSTSMSLKSSLFLDSG